MYRHPTGVAALGATGGSADIPGYNVATPSHSIGDQVINSHACQCPASCRRCPILERRMPIPFQGDIPMCVIAEDVSSIGEEHFGAYTAEINSSWPDSLPDSCSTAETAQSQMKKPYCPIVEPVTPPPNLSDSTKCFDESRSLESSIISSPDRLCPDAKAICQSLNWINEECCKTQGMITDLKIQKALLDVKTQVMSQEPLSEFSRMSLSERIFAENRAKAATSHMILTHMAAENSQPEIYYETAMERLNHKMFKSKLVIHLGQKKIEKKLHKRQEDETYQQLKTDWCQKTYKTEISAKLKSQDPKVRAFFETVFPEVKKERMVKERSNRKKTRSVIEFVDINMEEEKKDRQAIIPELLDAEGKRHPFINNNGLILDMAEDYINHEMDNYWTPEECKIFRDKLIKHSKNFALIASFLEKKSTADCVKHYYLTKKKESYKEVMLPKKPLKKYQQVNQKRKSK